MSSLSSLGSKRYQTERSGHGPNSSLKIRRRVSWLRSCIKQHSMCYRFPCRAPSYLSNIFLLLSTGHLEKRWVTLLCHSAVPGFGVPHLPPHLREYSNIGACRGNSPVHPPLLPPRSWLQIPDLLTGLSQFRHSVLLSSDGPWVMTDTTTSQHF